jgi:acyl-CoA synthetase (NDP forming)
VAQHDIIAGALQQGRTLLTEIEAKQVLQELGIATAMGQLAMSEAGAVQAAEAIGFPVVLKISSVEIVHKSDVGGV